MPPSKTDPSKLVDDKTRQKIANFLPEALSTALQSYHSFSRTDFGESKKDFSDHHNACKIAIAHIELLLKLAQYAHLPDDNVIDDAQQRHLVNMLENAQIEFNDFTANSKKP